MTWLMSAGQGGHVTEAVEVCDEGGRLQAPKTELLVVAAADYPLIVRRNRNALYIFGVTT